MPAFSKPLQPTSTAADSIPRSSRKRTLHPKLASEDNVHPQAHAIKRQKLASEADSKRNQAKLPARKSGGSTSQVKGCVEVEDDSDDEDLIMNDEENGDEEENENGSLPEDEGPEKNDESDPEDDESQEELDRKNLGMLHPLLN
jgi:hypothetical protein